MFISVAFAEMVQITSTSMEARDIKKEIHFIGDANVTQLRDWLHADRIIVHFDENNITKMYEAIGLVTFEFRNETRFYKGSADRVQYYPEKTQYILTGDAIVDDLLNNRHVNGEEIRLNKLSGDAEVRGDKIKPVKFIFDMEKTK